MATVSVLCLQYGTREHPTPSEAFYLKDVDYPPGKCDYGNLNIPAKHCKYCSTGFVMKARKICLEFIPYMFSRFDIHLEYSSLRKR